MSEPDFSEESIRRLAHELRDAPDVTMLIPAVEAYGILAIVQFAWRNPALDSWQKAQIEKFGRDLQEAIAARAPFAGSTLELGWNTAFDQPSEAQPRRRRPIKGR